MSLTKGNKQITKHTLAQDEKDTCWYPKILDCHTSLRQAIIAMDTCPRNVHRSCVEPSNCGQGPSVACHTKCTEVFAVVQSRVASCPLIYLCGLVRIVIQNSLLGQSLVSWATGRSHGVMIAIDSSTRWQHPTLDDCFIRYLHRCLGMVSIGMTGQLAVDR